MGVESIPGSLPKKNKAFFFGCVENRSSTISGHEHILQLEALLAIDAVSKYLGKVRNKPFGSHAISKVYIESERISECCSKAGGESPRHICTSNLYVSNTNIKLKKYKFFAKLEAHRSVGPSVSVLF